MTRGTKHGLLYETNRYARLSVVGMLLAAVLAFAAGSAGCAAGKASIPTAEELYAAGGLPRGADMNALRRGRTILLTECTGCHRLFLPGEYSTEQWRGIVRRMAARASLARDQAEDLARYLESAARLGK